MNAVVAYNVASKTKKGLAALEAKAILRGNEEAYSPQSDYEPATKKYIDDIARYGIHTEIGRTVVYSEVGAEDQTEFFYSDPVKQRDRLVLGVEDNYDYVVEINGVIYTYTSDDDATVEEIRDGLKELIEEDEVVTVVADGEDLVLEGVEEAVFYRLICGTRVDPTNEVKASNGNKYFVGSIMVFRNGRLVDASEYTAVDQNKVVFDEEQVENDKFVLTAFGGDAVISSTSEGGAALSYTKEETDAKYDTITSVDIKVAASTEIAKASAVAMAIAL